MKTITITIENEAGERVIINEPNQEVLEGKREPKTEQEREDAETARSFMDQGYSPVKDEKKVKAAAEEKPARGKAKAAKAAEPEASSTEEGK